jgi:hypothetical protein
VIQEDVFGRIVRALDDAGIPYMLTGSFAASYHGHPRATQDIDIVVAPTPDQLVRLRALLPESDYHLDLSAAQIGETYVLRWVRELGVIEEWRRAVDLSGQPPR